MENALISVIIPVYEVEPYMDRCVESVVNQTYSNLEIILVDDGSPDNCPAMCDAWAERDSRVKVIHKKNGGLSDARNAGMAAATGEYITFVDSDDWIAHEMLERLYRAMQRDRSDIAACTVKMVWEDETPDELLTVQTNCILDKHQAQAALLEEKLLKQPVWYKMYRAELIKDIPFEVGKFHEDVFWSYQAVGAADRVSIVDYVGYFYTQRPNSIMGENYSCKRLDALEAYERRYKFISREFPSLESEARLSVFLGCLYHGQMALLYLKGSERKQAMDIVKNTSHKYRISRKDYCEKPFKRRIWIDLGRISLPLTCIIRNSLQIGF